MMLIVSGTSFWRENPALAWGELWGSAIVGGIAIS